MEQADTEPWGWTSLAWPDGFFRFLCGGGKRVWTSSQAALVLTLPHGTGSVNKRNVMHTHLVAVSAYWYKCIIYLQLCVLWMVEYQVMDVKAAVDLAVQLMGFKRRIKPFSNK